MASNLLPSSKDYSMYVDFPVEIVGRDGLVKHYSFEESIGLYQRRIRLARLRGQANVHKEIDHCVKRIAQLRRSFFARYGWEAFVFNEPMPSKLSIEVSGEIAAYLRRRFGCGSIKERATLECLFETDHQSCFLLRASLQEYMLYVFSSQEEYNNMILIVQHTNQIDTEYIIDSFEDNDFWLLVTATKPGLSLPDIQFTQRDAKLPITDAVQALQNGDVVSALAHFMVLINENPYHRQAYWGGAILAEQMRVHQETRLLLEMALYYFPNDPFFLLRYASVLLRLQDNKAEGVLLTLKKIDPSMDVNFLWAVQHLLQKNYWKAQYYLHKIEGREMGLLESSVRWVNNQLHKKNVLQRSSLVLICVFLICSYMWSPFCLLGVFCGIGIWILAEYQWKRLFLSTLEGRNFQQLRLLPSNDIHQITKVFSNAH